MKPHTKKWRAIPSTLHTSNPASVRMDIVDDGAEFSPAFVAGDIMPEDARMIESTPDLIAALERTVFDLEQIVRHNRNPGNKMTVTEAMLRGIESHCIEARRALSKAKGQP